MICYWIEDSMTNPLASSFPPFLEEMEGFHFHLDPFLHAPLSKKCNPTSWFHPRKWSLIEKLSVKIQIPYSMIQRE